MALITKPRVAENCSAPGVGAFTLTGAPTGRRRFSAVCSVADTVYYEAVGLDSDGNEDGKWEEGLGTYSALNTLTRTTVLYSSTGSAVDFTGSTLVFLTAAADQLATRARAPDSTSLAYNSSATVAMTTTGASDVIDTIEVIVDTAFNGTSPSMTVGTAADNDKYVTAASVTLGTAGRYTILNNLAAQGAETLNIYFTAGGGASAGAARVIASYGTPT